MGVWGVLEQLPGAPSLVVVWVDLRGGRLVTELRGGGRRGLRV